ncbi:hypothetical protein QUB05_21030 [Microcoleus sp. F10-C6]|uniref:hypothetical protein n=1 Tax=unclassified Microcoleus TaxID=2642155 RepID=UPI002FD335AA
MATQPKGKGKGTSKTILRQEFANRKQSMLRELELGILTQQQTLGLTVDGDMKIFVRTLIQKLKKKSGANR